MRVLLYSIILSITSLLYVSIAKNINTRKKIKAVKDAPSSHVIANIAGVPAHDTEQPRVACRVATGAPTIPCSRPLPRCQGLVEANLSVECRSSLKYRLMVWVS